MDYSAAKRRKTSSSGSLNVNASNTKTRTSKADQYTVQPSRASYLSPTKASLARFNPDLLHRSGSAEPPRKQEQGSLRPVRRARTEDRALNERAHIIPEQSLARSAQVRGEPNGVEQSAATRVPSSLENTPSKLPRSILSPHANGDLLEARNLRTPRSRRRRIATAVEDDNPDREPSLPSTPTQLGLEAPPEKPRGLLFYTPSKRTGRQDQKQKGHSVVESADPFRTELAASEEQITLKLGARTYADDLVSTVIDTASKSSPNNPLLQRLELRLKKIQADLTKLTLQTKETDRSLKVKKLVLRNKKQSSRDSREIIRLCSSGEQKEDQQDHRKRYQCLTSLTSTSCTKPTDRNRIQDAFFRLGSFMPFCKSHNGDSQYSYESYLDEGQPLGKGDIKLHVDVVTLSDLMISQDALEVEQEVDVHTHEGADILKMKIRINPVSQIVSGISALHLASWASQEMHTWFSDDLSQKLQTIGGVLHRYMELTSLRSSCWKQCREALPDLVGKGTRASLEISQNGRQYLRLSKSKTRLTVKWCIIPSKQGDLHSDLSVEVDIPSKWRQVDHNNDLNNVEEVFQELVKKIGVTQATQTLAKALYPH